jgi:hypothetical protein
MDVEVVPALALAWVVSVAQIALDPTPSPAIVVVYAAPLLIWKSIKKA